LCLQEEERGVVRRLAEGAAARVLRAIDETWLGLGLGFARLGLG
jgi:hypothetical protein